MRYFTLCWQQKSKIWFQNFVTEVARFSHKNEILIQKKDMGLLSHFNLFVCNTKSTFPTINIHHQEWLGTKHLKIHTEKPRHITYKYMPIPVQKTKLLFCPVPCTICVASRTDSRTDSCTKCKDVRMRTLVFPLLIATTFF